MWDEEGGSGMRDGAGSDPSFPCPSWRRLSLDTQRSGIRDSPGGQRSTGPWRQAFSWRPPVAEADSEIKVHACS